MDDVHVGEVVGGDLGLGGAGVAGDADDFVGGVFGERFEVLVLGDYIIVSEKLNRAMRGY